MHAERKMVPSPAAKEKKIALPVSSELTETHSAYSGQICHLENKVSEVRIYQYKMSFISYL